MILVNGAVRRSVSFGALLSSTALSAAVIAVLSASPAVAQATTWTGGIDGDFGTPANWDNGAPGPGDTAVHTGAGGGNQPIVNGAWTVNILQLSGGTLTVGAQLEASTQADISGGTLSGAAALVTPVLNLSGGTVNSTATVSGTFTLSGTGTVSATGFIDGGATAVGVQNAAGTTMAGRFDGLSYTYSAGTLSGAVNVGTFTQTGGLVDATAVITATTSFALQSGTNNGQLTGAAGLSKTTGGTVILGNAANNYTGATSVAAGTLQAGGANVFSQASATTVDTGATLDLGGFVQTIDTVALAGGTITNGDLTNAAVTSTGGAISANIVGTSSLTNTSGTTTLSGANTYNGATTVNGGTLVGGVANTFSQVSVTTVNTGGTLDLGGFVQTIDTVALAGGEISNGDLTNAAITSTGGTISAVIAGTSSLTNTSGTTTLSAANTYDGATIVNGGALRLAGAGTLGSNVAGTTVAAGGALELVNLGASSTEALTLNGTGVANDGALRNIAGTNTLLGAITLGSATLIAADAGQMNVSGGITGVNTGLTVGGAGNVLINSVIGLGTGGLTKEGAGTLALSGANTYTGDTVVNGGGLQLIGGAAIADTANLIVNTGALVQVVASETVGSLAGAGNVSLRNGSTLTAGGNNSSTTFSGQISETLGVGSLVKEGAGTMALTGANTYTGTTTVNAGTLEVTGAGTLASTAITTIAGATFAADGGALAAGASITNAGAFNVTGGTESIAAVNGAGTVGLTGTLVLNTGASNIVGLVSGAGGLTVAGTSVTTLTSANYTGATTINNGGTLAAAGANAFSAASATTVNTGGTLNLSGVAQTINNVALAGGTVTNGSLTGAITSTGGTVNALGGAATLTTTAGTTTATGVNTYNGATNVNGGTFEIAAGASLASAITNAATFNNLGTATGGFTQTAGTATNSGTISGGANINGGAFTTTGTVNGAFGNAAGATTNASGALNGAVTNAGIFNITGVLTTPAGFTNNAGGLLTNNGTFTGALSNSGTVSNIGAWNGAVTNNATGAWLARTGTTAMTGNFINNGAIDLVDGDTTDIFTINGDLSGVGTINLNINLSNTSSGDLVAVTGQHTGTTTLVFNRLGALGYSPSDVQVLKHNGMQAATINAQLPSSAGLVDYKLVQKGDGWYVSSTPNLTAIGGIASNVSLVQSTIGTVVNRPSSPFVSGLATGSEPNTCGLGPWFRGTGGGASASGTTSGFGASSKAQVDLQYAGFQAGMDLACFNLQDQMIDASFGIIAGANLGATYQPIKDAAGVIVSETNGTFNQSFLGAYGTFASGPLSADIQFRVDDTTYTFTNATIGFNGSQTNNQRYSLNGSMSYAFSMEDFSIVPAAGFSIAHTTASSIAFGNGAQRLDLDASNSVVGFIGGTIAKTFILPDGQSAAVPFATATIYNDFAPAPTSTFTAGGQSSPTITSQNLGMFGEVSVGVNYARILDGEIGSGKQFNATVRADAKFSDRLLGAGVTGQVRVQF